MASKMPISIGGQRLEKKATSAGYRTFSCDLCGSRDVIEVPHARLYTNNQPIHICEGCGFVYVRRRRTANEIAKAWSEEIYSNDFGEDTYTARIPAVKARQTYVADFADVNIGLNGKLLCDIGAGEGQFLEIVSGEDYQAKVFGIEPSETNCSILSKRKHLNFNGTIEDYCKSELFNEQKFDVITMMWTLVNCYSCVNMVSTAHEMLKPGGKLVVAEGSRILVPFKKPLNNYFSTIPQDLHSFHFSANALKNLLKISGFEVVKENRYIDSDILCMIGEKGEDNASQPFEKDDYLEVFNFFERWHVETQMYYIDE